MILQLSSFLDTNSAECKEFESLATGVKNLLT